MAEGGEADQAQIMAIAFRRKRSHLASKLQAEQLRMSRFLNGLTDYPGNWMQIDRLKAQIRVCEEMETEMRVIANDG